MEKFCEHLRDHAVCFVKSNPIEQLYLYCPYKMSDISLTTNGVYIISNGSGSAFWDYACKYWEPTDTIYKSKKYQFTNGFDPLSNQNSEKCKDKKEVLSWGSEEHKKIEKEINYKEQFLCSCRNCSNRDIDLDGEIYCNKIFGIFGEKKFPVLWNGTCDYNILEG